MSPDSAVSIINQALVTTLWLGAPLLVVAFLVGALVSLFQVATSIQDNAVGTVPKLAAMLGALVLFLPWMLSRLMTYTSAILGDLGRYAR
jgi:flagellar biosynthetic protein FliQ